MTPSRHSQRNVLPVKDFMRAASWPLRDFLLDRFWRNVMSGIQDDQVLDAAADAPIPANVYFALIAGVEPSILQHAGSFFRAVPVARENVRPAHDELFIFCQLHFDSRNHRADVAGLDEIGRASCR